MNEALNIIEAIIQSVARDYPLTQIKLLSILPVSMRERSKQAVYIRSNEKIQNWNQAPIKSLHLSICREFVPVFVCV